MWAKEVRHDGSTQKYPEQVIRKLREADRVARHRYGTGLSRVWPPLWDHPGCQLWDHRRVVRRSGRGLPLAITSWLVMTWRSLVAFREVRVNEVREVLRCWLAGGGLRRAAERPGWTARLRAAVWRRLGWPGWCTRAGNASSPMS